MSAPTVDVKYFEGIGIDLYNKTYTVDSKPTLMCHAHQVEHLLKDRDRLAPLLAALIEDREVVRKEVEMLLTNIAGLSAEHAFQCRIIREQIFGESDRRLREMGVGK